MATNSGKHKKNYWILVIFFGIITLAGVAVSRFNPPVSTHHVEMMGGSMAKMMKHDVGTISIRDLLITQEKSESQSATDNSSHSSHHQSGSIMGKIHFITTMTIVCLLPFIVGGLVFLVIAWL